MLPKLIKNYAIILLLSSCHSAIAQQAVVNLHLARPSVVDSPTNQYIHALLTQSFAKVGRTVNFIYSVEPMNKKRIAEELDKNTSINLAWLSIKPNSAVNLIHTTLPIYKGLHGKRLLMINKDQQQRFASINTLDDLKPLIALQKQSWSDFEVLKRNGLTVNGELSYRSMIKALETKLGDYFPRSVSAIEAEVAKQQHLNLMVEPTIMLHYTNQYFFYSHKANKQLITLLQQGLIKMQQSGEFESLYQHYFGEKEQRLSLSTRKAFQLQ
ncbi:transporter substrate-binding domain-containing protein [Pseudoalteromonas shioyasakiensis]|uniref:transporter substrate-binding domain-containing protein n=1 Tax=Pseudoalteromonas shioyasakiensis TaxID=1190813 RepID=UPI002119246A|nr:transporter substrate-binding domain-containing protein [Pseudoalteromonas shioyasakiensis]MCQ8878572.1 transporter substrate-binding domain-containing protein [Pseudoalteromonas shioyasakiensis]